ncbi:MAG: kinase/pyrophosphorylase [Deltaproteobacteria bacterium]|nr:kinase/pyrophosphorylase [Deltaproteobacteria bacterium]
MSGDPLSPAEIFVVSDGTGDTASSATQAAMLQFRTPWRMRTFRDVRQESQARRVIDLAARSGALVVFTVVDERVARTLRDHGASQGVRTVDLLGPLISRTAQHLGAEPRLQPGLLHGFSDEYFRRIDAVEYAVRHDDGANLRTLVDADLVLTGISRTSKTPLSMYLAQRGIKTGNVPLVPGLEPPRELLELDPRRVFGLVLDPGALLTIRRSRLRQMHAPPYADYVDPDSVLGELARSRRMFREQGWRIVDISGKAVEETAGRILELIGKKASEPQGGSSAAG